MHYNKVVSVNDYAEMMGKRPSHSRKAWEIEMALRTLRNHEVVHGEAEILGAGAGHEPTIYYLSNTSKRVFATDLYLEPGIWTRTASSEMLADIAKFAPSGLEYDLNRIVVQHMDMRDLHYPDDSFDGIFSSGSIEHVGMLDDVAQAASELGRVLKPGGIMSLSTEFKISGEGGGWPGVLLLDEAQIMRYIVKASGCELVDDLILKVDKETLATVWPLDEIVRSNHRPAIEAVLSHGQYTFTSVHLALRKPEKKARKGKSND